MTGEPLRLIQGETVEWTRTLSKYPSGDGWTVKFFARGPQTGQRFEIVATPDASGTVYTFATTTETTAEVPTGKLSWQITATKTGKKVQIASGEVWIDPDFEAIDGTFDPRSQAKKDLDAVRAAISEIVSTGKCTQEYSFAIGDSQRSVKKYSLTELRELEKQLIARVNAETPIRRDGSTSFPVRPVRVGFKRL